MDGLSQEMPGNIQPWWVSDDNSKASMPPFVVLCRYYLFFFSFLPSSLPSFFLFLFLFFSFSFLSFSFFSFFSLPSLLPSFLSFLFFYKLKMCGSPVSSKLIGAIFPTAFVHFMSLSHILVILTLKLFHHEYIC